MSQQQPFVGQVRGGGHQPHTSSSSTDLRARSHATAPNGHAPPTNGHGPAPVGVPVPRGGAQNGHTEGRGGFAGPRSPPNAKNTSHVPCKFWRQGTCQAGNSCPFLHADTVGPCKYFAKGNCKFGMRCANEHITPDGRRINKANHLQMAQLNLGGRVMPTQIPSQTNSLLSLQQEQLHQPGAYPVVGATTIVDYPAAQSTMPYDIPTIDTTASSVPGSAIGSPRNDSYMGRSPGYGQGLTIHDVKIPGSWDPEASLRGNVSSSVPARFGLDSSPPSSLPNGQPADTTVRNHNSSNLGFAGNSNLYGLSPPANDESSQRAIRSGTMHSERFARRGPGISQSYGPKFLSSRLDSDDELTMDTMFDDALSAAIPSALDDLLTPNERSRRLSRNAEDENLANHRAALSGLGTPMGESPKIGSPNAFGASPSRFGPLFQRQAREKEASLGESLPNASNTFGHVGSPLRPSLLNPGSSPSLRGNSSRPTSTDFSVSSPPRQTISTSMLAQQLQRQRISSLNSEPSEVSANTIQHPGVQRVASGPGAPPNRLDRSVSGTSSTGVGREKIDEEPEGLFDMEEEMPGSNKWKRLSGVSGPWGSNKDSNDKDKTRSIGVIGGQRNSRGP